MSRIVPHSVAQFLQQSSAANGLTIVMIETTQEGDPRNHVTAAFRPEVPSALATATTAILIPADRAELDQALGKVEEEMGRYEGDEFGLRISTFEGGGLTDVLLLGTDLFAD